MQSEYDIRDRADKTLAVMNTIAADWVWDEMAIADFAAKIDAAEAAENFVSAQKAPYDLKRGEVNGLFETLEDRKVQSLGMARGRFRNDSANLALVNGVGEYGEGRSDTAKEAGEWAAAWQLIDPTWQPTAQNTLATFNTLRADSEAALQALVPLKTAWRKAAESYNALLGELEDLSVAWYDAATRVFKAGTPNGDLIRGQIPTFSGSSPVSPAAPPTP